MWPSSIAREYLAVSVGDPAVYHVAAGNRRRIGVPRWRELPYDPADVVEVDRVDVIRIRALEVHHVADDQRLAFVPAQRAGRHRPSHLQLAGIRRRDLLESAVAPVRVILAWRHPLVGVGGHFVQIDRLSEGACFRQRGSQKPETHGVHNSERRWSHIKYPFPYAPICVSTAPVVVFDLLRSLRRRALDQCLIASHRIFTVLRPLAPISPYCIQSSPSNIADNMLCQRRMNLDLASAHCG